MARSNIQFFLVFSVINLAFIIFGGWIALSSAGEKSNTFTGTCAAKGITGSLKFDWTSLSMHKGNKSTAVSGYTNNLTGSYKLP
jgi:hypothetical protein